MRRRAVRFASGSRDHLGSATAITASLSITRGLGEGRELRLPVPTEDLEGRETLLSCARKPPHYLLKAKNQALFLVLEVYVLLPRAGLIWHPENSKGKISSFCVSVCMGVCTRM